MAFQKQDDIHEEEPKVKWSGWKPIVIGISVAIVIICIIFAVPFLKMPLEVVETYTETEYKEEAYTEREPYKVTGEVVEKSSETLFDGTLIELGRRIMPDRWGTEVYFTIDLSGKPNPVASGSWEIEDFVNAFYVTITDPRFNQVYTYKGSEVAPQSDDFQFVPKYSGMYLMRFSTHYIRADKYVRLTLVLSWDGAATTTTERTEYREVTKYRQVPVQVEKQKTVTKYKRVSIWGLLFR
jgi:hypothetical protein